MKLTLTQKTPYPQAALGQMWQRRQQLNRLWNQTTALTSKPHKLHLLTRIYRLPCISILCFTHEGSTMACMQHLFEQPGCQMCWKVQHVFFFQINIEAVGVTFLIHATHGKHPDDSPTSQTWEMFVFQSFKVILKSRLFARNVCGIFGVAHVHSFLTILQLVLLQKKWLHLKSWSI